MDPFEAHPTRTERIVIILLGLFEGAAAALTAFVFARYIIQ